MKKLVLSMALLAGMTFVACSSDDDNGGGQNCVTCTFQDQSTEVCEQDGNAWAGGEDTGMEFQDYIDFAEMAGMDCN